MQLFTWQLTVYGECGISQRSFAVGNVSVLECLQFTTRADMSTNRNIKDDESSELHIY